MYLVLVCLVAALGGLLFGYDTAVIAGAIGFLQVHFQLNATWEGWTASSALAGCVAGVMLAGVVSDRCGRRTTLIFAAILFLLCFVPESPRWLTQQGQAARAHGILARIDGSDHATAAMLEIETALTQEKTSLAQLFLPGMRIVLAIGIVLAVLQQVTGINVFLYYAPEIFKAIATFCLWVANLIVSQTFPMMDKDPWLIAKFHHGYPFFIYAGFTVVLFFFVAMVLPETKGQTLEQIEHLWYKADASRVTNGAPDDVAGIADRRNHSPRNRP